jgi:CheY-like chemotaxis protein
MLKLLDLVLPNLDGFAFLQELHGDARLRTNIVFVLTASTAAKNKRRAYSLGIAGYLVKTALPQLRALLAAYSDIIEFSENISE